MKRLVVTSTLEASTAMNAFLVSVHEGLTRECHTARGIDHTELPAKSGPIDNDNQPTLFISFVHFIYNQGNVPLVPPRQRIFQEIIVADVPSPLR